MKPIRAVTQLVRPYSSLPAFLAICLALLSRTHDLTLSLKKSIPMLFVGMCTFIANDLDDIEKDRINHPDRPMPSGEIKPAIATICYFISLAASLFTIRFYIGSTPVSFLYYVLLSLCISYRYIVEYLPGVKPAYVAAAASVPILIVVTYYPRENGLYSLTVAVFLFVLGRELCEDLLDRPGDPVSFIHSLAPRRVATIALLCQAAGLFLLSFQARGWMEVIDLFVILVVLTLSYICWFRLRRFTTATALMKGILFLGLYFLA
jgi:geranylgeranylglycerol-phosphate geranylgeranyltransferase